MDSIKERNQMGDSSLKDTLGSFDIQALRFIPVVPTALALDFGVFVV